MYIKEVSTMKKFLAFFSAGRLTALSGCFLAASLIFLLKKHALPVDPAWGAVIISGIPLAWDALGVLWRERKISSALLVSIATVACLLMGEIFAAGEVTFIMALGEILEEKTVARAKKGLRRLAELVPAECRLLEGAATKTVAVAAVKPGALIRVLPGETIPLDGIVRKGTSSVNQAAMTGESLPVDKSVGDRVVSGSINCFGALDLEVTHGAEQSALQKMVRMVADAEFKRAPIQKKVDVWASWLVPAALAIAAGTYLCTSDILRAVTVLVVFCPCALVLATPTAVMAAIGQASKHGVLIKSGEALERMGKVNTVAFDKTGTLTFGRLQVTEVIPFAPFSEAQLLTAAATAELKSEHPIGKAVTAFARSRDLVPADPETFVMTSGRGVCAVAANSRILCGSAPFLAESGVAVPAELTQEIRRLRARGSAVILCAVSGKFAGAIALADGLRPEVPAVLGELEKLQVKPLLLTGDHRTTAEYFARQAGIREVRAELLPGGKTDAIAALQADGASVCMVGDGINDAPALKTARVGVAMGNGGSDIAIDAADIALLKDDLSQLPYLKRLADAVSCSISVNIILSMAINFAAIVLSVLGLMGPITGALVHNAGSVLVILNAALLYDRKI